METTTLSDQATSDKLLHTHQNSNLNSNLLLGFKDMSKANEVELQLMGGKAATLARLLKLGFPVPQGGVVFQEPQSEDSYQEIIRCWKKQGSFPVAARSSASGEDSVDFSYAGQFVTLLHLTNDIEIKSAIKTCFQAVHRSASKAYASHFDRAEIPMHILIQRMINSQFSGVYFSIDPRQENADWLIEVVEGQGEQLVSGQVTPFRFDAKNTSPFPEPKNWKKEYLEQIIHWGQEVEKAFGYKVDMEWAIDQEGQFWILQSRPITAHAAPSSKRKTLDEEWKRILNEYSPESTWDGHTFAEWTGIPTEVTFNLWQKTFKKNQAFDLALKSIGYEGLENLPDESLLDRVYGRAYLNLKSMEPVYFGRSPYRLNPFPRPHLEFDWSRLTPNMILRAPAGLSKMAQVAWNIQTHRSDLSKKALQLVQNSNLIPNSSQKNDVSSLRQECLHLNLAELKKRLSLLTDQFTKESLQGTFIITLLIEATTQGLMALLEKDLGSEKATETIHVLTGMGLQTVASKMHRELSLIEDSKEKWESFLTHFGHRGVGELELSHPRWIETNQPHRKKVLKSNLNLEIQEDIQFDKNPVLVELLNQLSSLRRPVFKQEWTELQKLMQIREEIKMELMKPYAQIRWLLLEISQRTELGSEIFWLRLEEISELSEGNTNHKVLTLAQERRQKALHLKTIDLPMFFTLQELKNVLEEPKDTSVSHILRGVCLSPGIASGTVHIVTNPDDEDLDSWPEDYILVTEATDPGWTPLFERAKAVIVARGGVLSHCAIVAREMGLPAVGEIRGASHLFKEGERVWVDGNHGTIRRGN